MRICRIATVPFFLLHHLGEQIRTQVAAGHMIVMVSSPGVEASAAVELSGAPFEAIPIARKVSPWADLCALFRLYIFFRRNRFDLVHSTTPKAGLLSALAGWLAGVPLRLHTFTGQAWAESRGLVRWLGKVADIAIVRLNTRCYADSLSQRDFIATQGIAPAMDIHVLGAGSLGGVDLTRFHSSAKSKSTALRMSLGIPSEAPVIGFVGRITRDKGIVELLTAFSDISSKNENAHLILVGPDESTGDPDIESLLRASGGHVHCIGYQPDPERWMATFDLFCLPSYREGFGNVVLEAAAMGIPSVGTRISGLVDSIIDNVTGMLVPVKDTQALAKVLYQLLEDTSLRRRLGEAAEMRARTLFDSNIVNGLLLNEYQQLAARIQST